MYPEKVELVAIEIYDSIKDELSSTTSLAIEKQKPLIMGVLCCKLIPKFIEGEISFTLEEFNELYKDCLVSLAIASLKEKGLINTIEDENGETLAFLTEKGKEVGKLMPVAQLTG